MNSERQPATIGELCDAGLAELQTGPFGSQLHAHDYVDDGVAVVPTEAIRDRKIDHSVLPKITSAKAQELARHRLRPGDILFARRGVQATGHIGYVRMAEDGFICGTGAIRLRLIERDGKVSSDFMSHVLANPASIEWFKFHAIGATMPNLNEGIIRSFPLTLPPLKDQQTIAALLSALDDKIELNRSINETLEAMARAIFKDWFVDFGPTRAKMEGRAPYLTPAIWSLFPDRLDEEGKPAGWSTLCLGEFFKLERGLSYKGVFLTETGIPMINLGCFQGGGHFDREKIKPYSGEFRPRHKVQIGDLVLANTDMTQKRIVLGSPHVISAEDGNELIYSHHVYAARPLSPESRKWTVFFYFHLLQPEFRERAEGFATGTTVLFLPSDAAEGCTFVFPSETINTEFLSIIDPIYKARDANGRENRILAATRDLLVPKLMSGEIRVKDAAKIVEAAL